MKRYRPFRFLPFALLGLAAFSLLVMLLWNALVPDLFGLPPINFLQAGGLLVLCRLLFGGFPLRPGGPWRHQSHWKKRMAEKWAAMTPEEREKFREGMRDWRHRCGRPPREEPEEGRGDELV